ncbi:hypothetical protein D6783_03870 [Candidatus Woesearchaeota archaeon]|nr:MAG: hypothetical protein D6783_03870 [Candidatus Woesearchaeota archaeon]
MSHRPFFGGGDLYIYLLWWADFLLFVMLFALALRVVHAWRVGKEVAERWKGGGGENLREGCTRTEIRLFTVFLAFLSCYVVQRSR